MFQLTKLALENNRLIILFALIITLAGPLSFTSHPSREDPQITIRTAVVTARFAGMSPERVENLITRKLEEEIRKIPEVEHIVSTSRTGVATVKAEVYERYFDMERIWQSLRNKMSDVKASLPDGTLGPFVNDDYGEVAMASIALTGEGFTLAELRDEARTLRDRLYAVKGVRKVELFGDEEEQIFIEINTARLAQLGLSAATIITTLQGQNIIMPGGTIQAGDRSFVVEPSGNFETVEDIASVVLDIPNARGQVAYLRDIAKIKRAYADPPEAPAFYNGEPAIVFSISMVDQYDADRFGRDLKRKISELGLSLPIGQQLNFITFQPNDIAVAVNGVMNNLYQTIVIVLIVVMAFLGIRTGLIVGSMVPLTILLSLVVMRVAGIELERMSLATLIISLGLLVDNGIVIAEQISTRIGQGENWKKATIETGSSLAFPLLSSTLTTALAFMPLMLAPSTAGEYTRSISLVIAITLLGSWFLAMTVTPLLCAWFIKAPAKAKGEAYQSLTYRLYRKLLTGILDFKLIFLLLVAGTLVGGVFLFQFIPKIFFPPSQRPQIQIIVDHPVGTHANETINTTKKLSNWIQNEELNPEVANAVSYVANGGPRFYLSLNPIDPDPHRAFLLVNVKNAESVPTVMARVSDFALDQLPEARVQVKPLSLGPGEAGLVEYRLVGPDSNVLKSLADQIKDAMRADPLARNVVDDWENRWVKLIVDVDQARARRVGVTSEDVARALNAILTGSQVTSYREGDTSIPVIIRAEEAERTNVDRLRTTTIQTATGQSVPLLQIAEVRGSPQFALIQRRDLERTLTVSGKHLLKSAQEFDAGLRPVIDALDLPSGYRIEVGGELESSAKAQGSLFQYMPLAFALILLILVAQFKSFRRAGITLGVIPLTLAGVSLGLLAAPGAVFGFMAILGLLSLAGIIINNAIVLIDRIDIEREAGKSVREAVVSASLNRLRPILITTATTILGLMPIILSRDILFYDMAIVISAGLAGGTVLTLGVVPVLYELLIGERKETADAV